MAKKQTKPQPVVQTTEGAVAAALLEPVPTEAIKIVSMREAGEAIRFADGKFSFMRKLNPNVDWSSVTPTIMSMRKEFESRGLTNPKADFSDLRDKAVKVQAEIDVLIEEGILNEVKSLKGLALDQRLLETKIAEALDGPSVKARRNALIAIRNFLQALAPNPGQRSTARGRAVRWQEEHATR